MFLKFVLEEIAPSVYNQAIADAQAYTLEKASETEISCYSEEFAYWGKRNKKTGR